MIEKGLDENKFESGRPSSFLPVPITRGFSQHVKPFEWLSLLDRAK
jgi:hypothetical protein